MKRFFVKVGLIKLTRVAKPTRGNTVITEMTGNPNFPAAETTVMLNELQVATDNLETANSAAESGDHTAMAIAVETELVFDIKFSVVARYVQDKADADLANSKSIINSAGFDARKTPESLPIPLAVTAIVAIYTGLPGVIDVKWKNSKFSRFYRLYHTTNPNDANSWSLIDTTTTRESTITGLAGFTLHFFKVVAVGTAGPSPDSINASCICLPAAP